MKRRVAVLGAGSWGASLADLLARKGNEVHLWEVFPEAMKKLRDTRKLAILPQLDLHPAIAVTSDLGEALHGVKAVVSAIPSEFVRGTWKSVRESNAFPSDAWVVSVTKGIENDTLKRMSEVIVDETPAAKGRVAVLSGPSHAEEVAQRLPTVVVSAGPAGYAEATQDLFGTDDFRVYTNTDFIGVEMGGALKNIYAIATGAVDGLGLGDNTKAALMTRGLYEMVRAGIAAGAQPQTFFGLSGVGDLIVTCASRHSRNRLLGEKIGQGKTLEEAKKEMTMVAEGVRTTRSVYDLAKKLNVHLPIVEEIYKCLFENKSARQSMHDLMNRPAGGELAHLEQFLHIAAREGGIR